MKRCTFLMAMLGVVVLFGCQRAENSAPVEEVEQSGISEVISPGECYNVNVKNLIATIANTQNAEAKEVARSVLALTKVGPHSRAFENTTSGPGFQGKIGQNFIFYINAPIGGYRVVVMADISCNELTHRVSGIRNVRVMKYKTNWTALPQYRTIVTEDSNNVYIYEMRASSKGLNTQGNSLVMIANKKNRNITFPKELASGYKALDMDRLRVDPIARGGKPFISSCKECAHEAERFEYQWNKREGLLKAMNDTERKNNEYRPVVTDASWLLVGGAATAAGTCGTAVVNPAILVPCGASVVNGGSRAVNHVRARKEKARRHKAYERAARNYDDYMNPKTEGGYSTGEEGAYKKALKAYYACVAKHPICEE